MLIKMHFSKALALINEGDVLLYRGKGLIANWIKWAGRGEYSHVAIASWRGEPQNSLLELCEFREFIGSRTVVLRQQVVQNPGRIDVYRPSSRAEIISTETVGEEVVVVHKWYEYDGRKATEAMREMTGLPYGWTRIWKLSRYHIPLLRFFMRPDFQDKSDNGRLYPVCSTAVAASIRRHYVDLMPNMADFELSPSDLSKCRDLHYLFTLEDG